MSVSTVVIAARYCGPPRSGNGGYVCGLVAKALAGAAVVRLKAPPPLEQEMRLEIDEQPTARLLHGNTVIGEARAATLDVLPPEPPGFEEAVKASECYVGFVKHSFPRCFVCGPERAAGDGLRIFPGAIEKRSLVAAPWKPDKSLAGKDGLVRSEFLWAALDCTGAFALLPVPEGRTILLGELCANIFNSVCLDEQCVVVGWKLGEDGRKRFAGSAIFAGDTRLVAYARATWIDVERGAYSGT
ncbi:hypothetical protein [Cupriavidus taiwanensis]|uniref:Uncharacterized protein n=1 Tax=Cupriavidus taiwanensis TaxID=164546 RepID=A0A7Z7JF95_9BURK|nr:hypothetical protein [Cupriavidus taiwanensis]SOZ17595.1 conserved hypothetical protein [Cupriavidus taiwanensis]SOZ96226.1 conserved hypothetical protein [Cupriavidus taiwanensis]SPC25506.1 conserved hypothetical protein [Cupriavidus taiwanensis]